MMQPNGEAMNAGSSHRLAFQLCMAKTPNVVKVKERVKEQGMEWWAVEAHRGSDWYCQPDMSSSQSEGNTLVSQLSGSFTGSGQLHKFIHQKGIPPALRPKVWRAVSGVVKKRSTVPETYYQDLCEAVQGRETATTWQIDHCLRLTFPGHPTIDSREGSRKKTCSVLDT